MSLGGKILNRVKHAPDDGRPPIQYRIQLLEESIHDDVASFMVENYLPREPLFQCLGVHEDEKATEEMVSIWKETMSLGLSLGAFLEDDEGNRGKMIGCYILAVEREETLTATTKSIRSEKLRKLSQTYEDSQALASAHQRYGVPIVLVDYGGSTLLEFERRGVAGELMRMWSEVGRLSKPPVSAAATNLTGPASPRFAARMGYEVLSEMDLTDYKIDGKIVYPGLKYNIIKYAAKRFD